jgi:hypothetical protein
VRTRGLPNAGCPRVPTRKALRVTLDVPEGIADVLKVEVHALLFEARPLAVPVAEKVAMRALTRLMTVGSGDGFYLLRSLGMGWKCKQIKSGPQRK